MGLRLLHGKYPGAAQEIFVQGQWRTKPQLPAHWVIAEQNNSSFHCGVQLHRLKAAFYSAAVGGRLRNKNK